MLKKLFACVFLFLSFPVFSNEYKLIIMNPPGSLVDNWARKFSRVVRNQSGVNLVVLNIPAGNGLLAATTFKKEPLAVAVSNSSQLVYLPLHNEEQPYSVDDFNNIAPLGLTGVVWFTHPDSGINTLNDLVNVLPQMPKGAIAVGTGDGQANALAFVRSKRLDVPVVSFKSAAEMVLQVAGKHVTVGVAAIAQDTIWSMADTGQIKLLGIVHSNQTFTWRGYTLQSINHKLKVPVFFSGAWLAITPGESDKHIQLREILLKALKEKEIQELTRATWPYGNISPLNDVIDNAKKHKDLLR
jgi:tripartite-type tricarboxylate transporter receptor subunit TctC